MFLRSHNQIPRSLNACTDVNELECCLRVLCTMANQQKLSIQETAYPDNCIVRKLFPQIEWEAGIPKQAGIDGSLVSYQLCQASELDPETKVRPVC
jgi:hypothetical protein